MSKETKHAPPPWEVADVGDNNMSGSYFDGGRSIVDKDGWYIVHCWDLDDEYIDALNPAANAAHIVKCVNHHDELVAALERISGECTTKEGLQYARDILAKVQS